MNQKKPASVFCVSATVGDKPSEVLAELSATLFSLASVIEAQLGVGAGNRQLIWTFLLTTTENGTYVLKGGIQIAEMKPLVTGGLSAMSGVDVPVSVAKCDELTIHAGKAAWQEMAPEALGTLAEKIYGHFMMR